MKVLYSSKISKFLLWSLLITTIAVGCKKKNIEPEVAVPPSRAQLTKDSIYLYAKQVYLWNDVIPSYDVFNPRKYTQFSSELDNFNKELFDITQLKINSVTGKPFEYKASSPLEPKFSYIDDSDNTSSINSTVPKVSEVTLEGIGDDFGVALNLVGTLSSYQIYLRYVSPDSPADKSLFKRGDILNSINGRVFGTNFTTADENFINNAFEQSSITLGGRKSDGTTFSNKVLTKTSYTSNPIYKETVITSGSKKIGYLAFARFSNTDTNAGTPLRDAFAKFVTQGATDLVVDLRYNGGGYVSTAELMANLIAPSSKSGSTMFTEYFNSTMQNKQASILKNQPLLSSSGQSQYQNGNLVTYFDQDWSVAANTYKFSKQGSLSGITKVVFIVSESTASASELVINVLKPHMDVKLVGSKDNTGKPINTYGKPVGFFPITIDKYDVYFSMFETRNSLGEGNYHAGFVPNITAADDVTRDFGDPAEAQFAAAINYITTGALIAKASTATIMGTKMSITPSMIKSLGKDNSFKGMIETRHKLK
ncbi:MAG: hypothetical protein H7Y07_12765 [Pyrinomonadaceae bacterium]|nr:hypothetical protein [Sphingobacteriaceae bacterium]